MTAKTYTEMARFDDFTARFRYLSLRGRVGEDTFGFDRWINQAFYRSKLWKDVRNVVINRDRGCDLGMPGYEIHDRILIHHINPIRAEDIVQADESILDPEFLITTTHNTHNAIHYGDERLLRTGPIVRTPGDTTLWGTRRS